MKIRTKHKAKNNGDDCYDQYQNKDYSKNPKPNWIDWRSTIIQLSINEIRKLIVKIKVWMIEHGIELTCHHCSHFSLVDRSASTNNDFLSKYEFQKEEGEQEPVFHLRSIEELDGAEISIKGKSFR